MPSTNWEKLAEIVGSANALPPSRQDAYLVAACNGNDELLARAREMVAEGEDVLDLDTTREFPAVDPLLERTTIDFSDPDKLVGQTLDGRFYIEKNLKESGGDAGGIGVVYLAKDTKLMGKDVVVKILNETALQHPDIVRKFEHEKEALVRLDHPGIVRILDSGKLNDGNPFMVMDFIRGHSLRKAIQMADRLPLDVVANITESVTDALSAAHAEKILHRDIKPENIMLTPIEEGMYRVRLIDFGIARVEESKLAPATEISRAIGSVHYISPEQLIGNLDLTPAADIFSFAIVVYEMLTGELPYKPRALADMYQLELAGVKTLPSALRADMPREAERILLSALEFDATKRPQNARAFGRWLARELKIDANETDRFYASIKTEFHTSPTTAMPAPDPDEFLTVQRVKAPSLADKLLRVAKWAVPLAFILALLSVAGAYYAWNSGKAVKEPISASVATDLGPDRQITYFLMVQKMRNGKPFEAPFKSSGQAGVEKDYRFDINFGSDASGYMYVFNYGKNDKGIDEFSIQFPIPGFNGDRSDVAANQIVTPPAINIEGKPGTETFWLIWTKDLNADLEALVKAAFANGGKLPSADGRTLQAFLDKNRPSKPEVVKDSVNQQTVIKAKGDEVVHQFELEHR